MTSVVATGGIRLTGRYPAVVAKLEVMGVRALRDVLTERLAMTSGAAAVHTVVLSDSQPRGVIVSVEWRRRAMTALGEATDLAQVPIVPVTALRDRIGAHVGGHALATRRSKPLAALVPWDWYVRAAEMLGEPVDL
jgi:hypothetical protein